MSLPTDSKTRIYLAGPEVFLKDAIALGEQKKALCQRYGFIGLFPLDAEYHADDLGEKTNHQSPQQQGLEISRLNERLIHQADCLIANLTPFRGVSADVGTVYELGLARGLGKPIFAYSNNATPYQQRVVAEFGVYNQPSRQTMHQQTHDKTYDGLRDRNGYKIEEFDLHDNLMLEGGLHQSGSELLVQNPEMENKIEGRLDDLSFFEQCLIAIQRSFSTDELG